MQLETARGETNIFRRYVFRKAPVSIITRCPPQLLRVAGRKEKGSEQINRGNVVEYEGPLLFFKKKHKKRRNTSWRCPLFPPQIQKNTALNGELDVRWGTPFWPHLGFGGVFLGFQRIQLRTSELRKAERSGLGAFTDTILKTS